MFSSSPMMSSFSAGAGISAVDARIRRLEALVNTMGAKPGQPMQAPSPSAPSSFKAVLGMDPPPRLRPMTENVQSGFEQFQPTVQKYARQYGVDPDLVNAVIRQESGFNPNAVSPAGAQGLMQLMPQTSKDLGVSNPFDAEQNIAGGVKLLSQLLGNYNGNVALALAAYNAGMGAVKRHQGIPPYKETQNYVRKILKAFLAAKNPQDESLG